MQKHIQHPLHSQHVLRALEQLKREARPKDYQQEYERSIADPEGFWSEVAKELHWHEPWTDGVRAEHKNGKGQRPGLFL